MPSRPMAAAAMSQRFFCTRLRSRRNSPSTRNSAMPQQNSQELLEQTAAGALEAVTGQCTAWRGRRRWSPSQSPRSEWPAGPRNRATSRTVSPRKARGMAMDGLSPGRPRAAADRPAPETTVSHRKDGQMAAGRSARRFASLLLPLRHGLGQEDQRHAALK